jgi:hypothetical protein
MKTVRHRPKLVNLLADEMMDELYCQRTRESQLGDKFEFLKTKVRYRLTKEETRDLCLCLAQKLVEASPHCKITAVREEVKLTLPKVKYKTNKLIDQRIK